MFSRSANGLQTLLNKLESYCEKTEVTVNLDKTKVMIFNNCGKSLNNYSFKYGVNKLNNVKSSKYLGMTLNPYGNFSLAREALKKKKLKIKRVLDQIGLGYLWTKAHENDIGILNIIKQRLKDIELQGWLSDVNNAVRKDTKPKVTN